MSFKSFINLNKKSGEGGSRTLDKGLMSPLDFLVKNVDKCRINMTAVEDHMSDDQLRFFISDV